MCFPLKHSMDLGMHQIPLAPFRGGTALRTMERQMRECFWDIGEIARRAANLPVDDRVAAWQAIQRKTRAWLAEFQTPEVWEGYAYLPTALTAVPPGLEDIARIAREAFQFEEGHGVLAEVALLHYMNSAAGEHLRFFPDADGSETSSLFTIDADGSEAGSARFERILVKFMGPADLSTCCWLNFDRSVNWYPIIYIYIVSVYGQWI